MDRKFRPEAFVEFLNWNLVGELMPRGGKCFQLRGDSFRRVRKVLGMADKYGVVYDNMVGERFIERCADIWHSVGLIKSSNRVDAVYLGEERMKVDVPREIHLADDKVVVPQRFVLRRFARFSYSGRTSPPYTVATLMIFSPRVILKAA